MLFNLKKKKCRIRKIICRLIFLNKLCRIRNIYMSFNIKRHIDTRVIFRWLSYILGLTSSHHEVSLNTNGRSALVECCFPTRVGKESIIHVQQVHCEAAYSSVMALWGKSP